MAERGRIDREKRTVSAMIALYCREKHGVEELCDECRELAEYSHERLDRCPFGNGKTVCARCAVHCYRPEMRERIRRVMRTAGPRMLFRHPVMAVRYLIDKRRAAPADAVSGNDA